MCTLTSLPESFFVCAKLDQFVDDLLVMIKKARGGRVSAFGLI
jgi:hypothetical protein